MIVGSLIAPKCACTGHTIEHVDVFLGRDRQHNTMRAVSSDDTNGDYVQWYLRVDDTQSGLSRRVSTLKGCGHGHRASGGVRSSLGGCEVMLTTTEEEAQAYMR